MQLSLKRTVREVKRKNNQTINEEGEHMMRFPYFFELSRNRNIQKIVDNNSIPD
jgi:hypothetical protein